MYEVTATNEKFESFTAAVAVAHKIGSTVVDENGTRRWSPAPKISAAKLRRYEEQKAAYEAQKRLGR